VNVGICNFWVILALIAAVPVGCSRGPVISITNRSGVRISDVVVSGPKFSQFVVGTLASGEERRVVVHPHGESSLRLTFKVGEQQIDSGSMEYFEDSSMYRIFLTVGANLKVVSSSSITNY